MTKYPNLLELHKYHPYGDPALCDYAGIEPELLHAVLEDGETLLPEEIGGAARLYRVPSSLLKCRKVSMLDMKKRRHWKLVGEIDALYVKLKCMAREGNQKAEKYLEWADPEHQRFLKAAYRNKLSYCHYLGIKEQLSQYISFSTPKPKRRGLLKVAPVQLGDGGR